MQKKEFVGLKHGNLSKLYLIIVITLISILLGTLYLLKPIILEEYCKNRALKIVGNQWGKLYPAKESNEQYTDQITWGFREQLKCEQYFFKLLRI